MPILKCKTCSNEYKVLFHFPTFRCQACGGSKFKFTLLNDVNYSSIYKVGKSIFSLIIKLLQAIKTFILNLLAVLPFVYILVTLAYILIPSIDKLTVKEKESILLASSNKDLGVRLTPLKVQVRNRPNRSINKLNKKQNEIFKVAEGLLLVDFLSGSKAKTAGLRRGDVVLAINNKNIKTIEDLEKQVGGKKQFVKIKVERNNEIIELKVRLNP